MYEKVFWGKREKRKKQEDAQRGKRNVVTLTVKLQSVVRASERT